MVRPSKFLVGGVANFCDFSILSTIPSHFFVLSFLPRCHQLWDDMSKMDCLTCQLPSLFRWDGLTTFLDLGHFISSYLLFRGPFFSLILSFCVFYLQAAWNSPSTWIVCMHWCKARRMPGNIIWDRSWLLSFPHKSATFTFSSQAT